MARSPDVPKLKTIFGYKSRPHRSKARSAPPTNRRQEVVIETPVYNLTVFKLHFGGLTLKGYTEGEHVLRFEAMVHNTRHLRCGRLLDKFPDIVEQLRQMVDRFLDSLSCVDACFIQDSVWDDLPTPTRVGATRVGGIDVHKPRTRAVLAAVIALSASPHGFSSSQMASKVGSQVRGSDQVYGPRHAAYDIKKLRGKSFLQKLNGSRRYQAPTPQYCGARHDGHPGSARQSHQADPGKGRRAASRPSRQLPLPD